MTARSSSLDDAPKDGTRRDIMLLALTGAAGSLDAIGFLALGHVFTANMTGNTVLLGLHVAQEQGAAAVRSLIALLGFGVGLVIGALIVERSADTTPWPRAVTQALALEVLILAVFTVGSYVTAVIREVWETQSLIALSAIAMGIQSAAARRLDVPGIATTYLTGTFTSAVTSLVAKSRRSPRTAPTAGATATSHPWRRQVGLQLLTLVVYGLGALIAGILQAHWPRLSAVLPFAVVAAVVVTAPIWIHQHVAK